MSRAVLDAGVPSLFIPGARYVCEKCGQIWTEEVHEGGLDQCLECRVPLVVRLPPRKLDRVKKPLDYQPRMAQRNKELAVEVARVQATARALGAELNEGEAVRLLTEKVARDLDYQTPQKILDMVRGYFGGPIPLDPATVENNPTGATRFFTPKENGLAHSWVGHGVFCNPPYGKPMRDWLGKIAEQARAGVEIIALLPVNRFEQAYLTEVIALADTVCWVRKRVAFVRPSTGEPAKGNPYSSMVLGLGVCPRRFARAFGSLGLCRYMGSPG